MAEDSIALMNLVEKYTDDDLFRDLGQFVLQRLMEFDPGDNRVRSPEYREPSPEAEAKRATATGMWV